MNGLAASLTLPQIEGMLENLERRAGQAANALQKARAFNLAGDVCFDAGQPERGLTYYDKAITTHTDDQQYDAAARLCEKIIALWPSAVRPYWTLAALAIQRANNDAARAWVAAYVLAAERNGLAKVACTHLVTLATLSEDSTVLESIADGLLQLNDSKNADLIYGRMYTA